MPVIKIKVQLDYKVTFKWGGDRETLQECPRERGSSPSPGSPRPSLSLRGCTLTSSSQNTSRIARVFFPPGTQWEKEPDQQPLQILIITPPPQLSNTGPHGLPQLTTGQRVVVPVTCVPRYGLATEDVNRALALLSLNMITGRRKGNS